MIHPLKENAAPQLFGPRGHESILIQRSGDLSVLSGRA